MTHKLMCGIKAALAQHLAVGMNARSAPAEPAPPHQSKYVQQISNKLNSEWCTLGTSHHTQGPQTIRTGAHRGTG